MAISLNNLRRIGGDPALDFVNTVDPRNSGTQIDYIRSYSDLVQWSRLEGVLDVRREHELNVKADRNPRRAAVEFRRAVRLRELIARIFLAVADGARAEPRDVVELGSIAATARTAQVLKAETHTFAWRWKEPVDLDLPV